MLISTVQQSDSVIQIYMYIYILFFHILFHSGLSQDIGYSSLCCTVGPLFIHPMYTSLHLLTPTSHSIPAPPSLPLGNVYVCESVFVLKVSR